MSARLNRLIRWSAVAIAVIGVAIFFTPLVKWAAELMAVDWYEGGGDVLVVLGGDMLMPGTSPNAALGYNSYLRATYAGWMLRSFRFQRVVVSGADGVAEAMSRLLVSGGVPADAIWLDPQSHTTFDNARFVKKLLQQHGVRIASATIVLVTSDYHSWRARAVFAKAGVPVRVMPVPDVTKRAGWIPYRLEGAVTIGTELCKDAGYKLKGKI